MRLRWTTPAANDLCTIVGYIQLVTFRKTIPLQLPT